MCSKVVSTVLLAFALGSVIEAAREPHGLRGRGPAALAAKEAKIEALANNASNNDASKVEQCRTPKERHPNGGFTTTKLPVCSSFSIDYQVLIVYFRIPHQITS